MFVLEKTLCVLIFYCSCNFSGIAWIDSSWSSIWCAASVLVVWIASSWELWYNCYCYGHVLEARLLQFQIVLLLSGYPCSLCDHRHRKIGPPHITKADYKGLADTTSTNDSTSLVGINSSITMRQQRWRFNVLCWWIWCIEEKCCVTLPSSRVQWAAQLRWK